MTGLLIIAFTVCIHANSYADLACKPVVADKEWQERLDKVQRYVSTSESQVVFDVDAAVAAGEDEMVIEIGRKMNEISRVRQEIQTREGMPILGNLYVPGHGGDETPACKPGMTDLPVMKILSKEWQERLEKVQRYVSTSKEGQVAFDVDAAVAAGEDEMVIEIGRKVNEISRARQGGQTRDGIELPGYGNWCGPLHSGPEPPTGLLDSLCQMHDNCYAERGYFACSCDAELRAMAAIAIASGRLTPTELMVAAAIVAYFTAAPCWPWL